MGPWRGDQGHESVDEFTALHQDVAGAVAPAGLQTQGEPAVGMFFQALVRERRSRDVAAQALESAAIVRQALPPRRGGSGRRVAECGVKPRGCRCPRLPVRRGRRVAASARPRWVHWRCALAVKPLRERRAAAHPGRGRLRLRPRVSPRSAASDAPCRRAPVPQRRHPAVATAGT